MLSLTPVLGGCGSAVVGDADPDPPQIRLSGSGTTLPLMHLLTDAFPGSAEFVYLPGMHSGGGIEGARQGALELGVVSRGLEGEEFEYGLELTVLARDALALAVHPSVGVDDLTTEQCRAIYSGELRDWAELGGASGPIIVLDRPEEESAKKVLREHLLGAGFEVMPDAIQLFYEGDMVDAVEATPGSVGFFSMGYGIVTGADVRIVSLDGVMPTAGTISDGTYPMMRELGVVHDPESTTATRDFLAWATGSEAVELLISNGYAAPPVGETD